MSLLLQQQQPEGKTVPTEGCVETLFPKRLLWMALASFLKLFSHVNASHKIESCYCLQDKIPDELLQQSKKGQRRRKKKKRQGRDKEEEFEEDR